MAGPEYDDVYAALWPRLVRTAYAVSGDLGVAEDAVQTAFAKAYRGWRRISRLDAPEAYLRRMVVNEVLNDRRRARRRHEISSEAPPEPPGQATDPFAGDDLWLIADGFVRGKRAAWLPSVKWETLLDQPVTEVRKLLKVGEPRDYVPLRSSELREKGLVN